MGSVRFALLVLHLFYLKWRRKLSVQCLRWSFGTQITLHIEILIFHKLWLEIAEGVWKVGKKDTHSK
jgi:hypothetical protein